MHHYPLNQRSLIVAMAVLLLTAAAGLTTERFAAAAVPACATSNTCPTFQFGAAQTTAADGYTITGVLWGSPANYYAHGCVSSAGSTGGPCLADDESDTRYWNYANFCTPGVACTAPFQNSVPKQSYHVRWRAVSTDAIPVEVSDDGGIVTTPPGVQMTDPVTTDGGCLGGLCTRNISWTTADFTTGTSTVRYSPTPMNWSLVGGSGGTDSALVMSANPSTNRIWIGGQNGMVRQWIISGSFSGNLSTGVSNTITAIDGDIFGLDDGRIMYYQGGNFTKYTNPSLPANQTVADVEYARNDSALILTRPQATGDSILSYFRQGTWQVLKIFTGMVCDSMTAPTKFEIWVWCRDNHIWLSRNAFGATPAWSITATGDATLPLAVKTLDGDTVWAAGGTSTNEPTLWKGSSTVPWFYVGVPPAVKATGTYFQKLLLVRNDDMYLMTANAMWHYTPGKPIQWTQVGGNLNTFFGNNVYSGAALMGDDLWVGSSNARVARFSPDSSGPYSSVSDLTPTANHSVTLTGLLPGTTYYYTVKNGLNSEGKFVSSFTTPAADTVPPTINITVPAGPFPLFVNNSGCPFVVSGTASDNVAVTSVTVKIDGTSYPATGTTSWTVTIPCASIPLGRHTLMAIASDGLNLTETTLTDFYSAGVGGFPIAMDMHPTTKDVWMNPVGGINLTGPSFFKYNAAGLKITYATRGSCNTGVFDSLADIIVDTVSPAIWMLNTSAGQICKFSSVDGSFIGKYLIDATTPPTAISFDVNNQRIWAISGPGRKVYKIRLDGTVESTFAALSSALNTTAPGIYYDAASNFVFYLNGNNTSDCTMTMVRMSTTGVKNSPETLLPASVGCDLSYESSWYTGPGSSANDIWIHNAHAALHGYYNPVSQIFTQVSGSPVAPATVSGGYDSIRTRHLFFSALNTPLTISRHSNTGTLLSQEQVAGYRGDELSHDTRFDAANSLFWTTTTTTVGSTGLLRYRIGLPFTFDNSLPTVTLNLPATTSNVNEVATGTATDNDQVAKIEIQTALAGPWTTVSSPGTTPAPYTYTLNLTPGTNTITVRATDAAGNQALATKTIVYNNPDFTITVTPSPQTKNIGQTAIFSVVTTSLYGYAQPVNLTYSDSLGGTVGTFSTSIATPPANGTSTITLTVNTTAASAGVHLLTVTGTDAGGKVRTGTATLNLNPPPDFILSVIGSGSQSVLVGTTATFTLNIQGTPAYVYTSITWSTAALPPGVSQTFSALVGNPSSGGTGVTTLSLTTTTPFSATPIIVRATDGLVSHQVTITLAAIQPPDFSFTMPPLGMASAIIAGTPPASPGGSMTYDATVTALNGFTGQVHLSFSTGTPDDAFLVFVPSLNDFIPSSLGTPITITVSALSGISCTTTPNCPFAVTARAVSPIPPSAPALTKTQTFTVLVAPDTTPPIISGISASPDIYGVTVFWTTNEPADSLLLICSSASVPCTTPIAVASDPAFTTSHTVIYATGLSAQTQYWYAVVSKDQAAGGGNTTTVNLGASSQPLTFTTLQAPDTSPADITILQPATGTFTGLVTIDLRATDNIGLDHIHLAITSQASGATILTQDFPSSGSTDKMETFPWNTALLRGTYIIAAQAFAQSGPNSIEKTVTVILDNDITAPQVTSGPDALVNCTGSSCTATITWTTDDPSTSEVDYSITVNCSTLPCQYGSRVGQDDNPPRTGANFTNHRVTLTGLATNQLYHYRITSCNATNLCTN